MKESFRQSLVKWGFVALMAVLVVLGLRWRELAGPGDPDGGPDGRTVDANHGPATDGAGGAVKADLRPAADASFNPGWIGGACRADADCDYPGGFCLVAEEGFPRGTCSARCRRLCPERRGELVSRTFCIEDPTWARGQGICLAQCNPHITVSGCRPGYVCTSMQRLAETTTRMVCLPNRGTPFPQTDCTRKLEALGVTFSRVQIADEPARPGRPGGPAPAEPICQLDTPVLLATPLHHVDFRHQGEKLPGHLLVACPLALALERLTRLLGAMEVVEIEHNGTYVCRAKRGGGSLSGHGRGLAIDVTALQRTLGESIPVETAITSPRSAAGRFMVEVIERIRSSGIFDMVLDPRHSATHRDHLHLEVR